MPSTNDRCLLDQYRDVLALILRSDRTARQAYRHLMKCGATRFRPDHMYVRQQDGSYLCQPDLGAWHCDIPRFGGIGASMLRGRDGVWFLNS